VDKIVDDYAPVVEGLEIDIEEVEKTVFSGSVAPVHRIYLLRREVTDFYRAVHPLLGPAAAITQGGVLQISDGLRQYFRDVDDHLKLVNEEIMAQRDLLSTILQANMAVVASQQNEVVRKISAWFGIITVPTFVASVYGMNFTHMPELDWKLGYPLALAVMFGLAISLYFMFKRVRWL
jgi:magnesium transporter